MRRARDHPSLPTLGLLATFDDSGLDPQRAPQDRAAFSLAPSSKVAKSPSCVRQAAVTICLNPSAYRDKSRRMKFDTAVDRVLVCEFDQLRTD